MSVAIYPGSFDPLTNGHFDIVKRFAGHFEKLYLVVANSSKKSYLFSHDERVALAKDVLSSVDGVEVVGWQGLMIVLGSTRRQRFFVVYGRSAISITSFQSLIPIRSWLQKLKPSWCSLALNTVSLHPTL